MKAHLINTHLLVPRSRSSAEVKVEYQGYISQKMAISMEGYLSKKSNDTSDSFLHSNYFGIIVNENIPSTLRT